MGRLSMAMLLVAKDIPMVLSIVCLASKRSPLQSSIASALKSNQSHRQFCGIFVRLAPKESRGISFL
jgi:hypothetical protein